MEFSVKHGVARKQKTACLIVGVHAGRTLSERATDLDKASRGALMRIVQRGDVSGKVGEALMLPDVSGIDAERVLLLGIGKREGISAEDYQKLVAKAAETLKGASLRNGMSTLLDVTVKGRDLRWVVDQHVTAFAASSYRYTEFKSKAENHALTRMALLVDEKTVTEVRAALAVARAKVTGMNLLKDLANRPANHCTPTYLAEQAEALAARHDNLSVNVLEEADMEALGMGALLSVSRGSRQPAKLITLEYKGRDDGAKPIVLVGKGVTFDSGGISLKPGPAMDEMKFDMTGAASVLGVMAAIAEMAPAINVVGVVPATENLPDGNASKPSDVVTSMSGQTIEILNTDAEGRLILCDALTYSARFEPEVVIDIATLTGACVVALGEHASGLLSNNDELAEALLNAGQKTGDRAWRLPLWDDYQKQLDSPVADMANVGGRNGGTITAACFLARFTKDYRWAHLDIAGTAWGSGKNKYATGRPLPLLLEYILARAERA
jgi:leucyl aminopeptidase